MIRKVVGIAFICISVGIVAGVVSCGTSTPTLLGDATAGAADFTALCEPCHTFGVIKPVSNLIVNDMGTIDAQMAGIFLTNQQIADLQAYLL
jgi:hypothetical protein